MSIYQPKSILITGVAGFIGSHVLVHLVSKYHECHFVGLDKLDVCSSTLNFKEIANNSNFKFVKGNILDYKLVYNILIQEKIDTVMHFAANSHVDLSFGNSLHFTENNVKGTHCLAECVRAVNQLDISKNQIKRFIHVSTDEVVSNDENDATLKDHNSPLVCGNPYSGSKAGGELIIKSYGTSYKLPFIITRSNNVVGPKQFVEKLVGKFITLLSSGKKCSLHGSGKNKRSFIYIDDVVDAFDVILHRGELGQIYGIGTLEEYENVEVLKRLVNLFRKHYPNLLLKCENPDDFNNYVEYVRDRPFNDHRYRICTKALEALGWKQQHKNFDECLLKTIKWYLENPNHWLDTSKALLPHVSDVLDITEEIKDHFNSNTNSEEILQQILKKVDRLDSNVNKLLTNDKNSLTSHHAKTDQLHWLIYGSKGWIGQSVVELIQKLYPHHKITCAQARADNKSELMKELQRVKPDRVLSFLGRTHGEGYNTIDYLEQPGKLSINLRDNLKAPMNLMLCCKLLDIHLTYFSTGCIFHYDDEHIVPNENNREQVIGFKESDRANFTGSSYSAVKAVTDEFFQDFAEDSALNVRIRMPITADLKNPRNFITKIITYSKICSIENSMTVLPELLPIMLKMSIERKTGTINLTNPGTISHNRILELYKEIINPNFTWQNFTIEEQNQILAAKRSNNYLETKKLQEFAPEVLPIEESIRQLFNNIKSTSY